MQPCCGVEQHRHMAAQNNQIAVYLNAMIFINLKYMSIESDLIYWSFPFLLSIVSRFDVCNYFPSKVPKCPWRRLRTVGPLQGLKESAQQIACLLVNKNNLMSKIFPLINSVLINQIKIYPLSVYISSLNTYAQ